MVWEVSWHAADVKSKDENGEGEEADAGNNAKEKFVSDAPFLDVDDVATSANGEIEDDERDECDDSVAGDHEWLIDGIESEDVVASDEERNDDEGEFGKAGGNAKRESFGVAVGELGAVAKEFGDDFGKPKFGAGFVATIVEKPHDESEGEKDADGDGEDADGESTTESVSDEEAGGSEEEQGDGADARDEAADEIFGFAFDVFAGGFVIEQEEAAESELQRSVDDCSENNGSDGYEIAHTCIVSCLWLKKVLS